MTSPLESYNLEQAEEDISALRGQVETLQEALNLIGGQPNPNPPVIGNVILFAAGGQPNYINSSGLVMGLRGAQNAFFPGITITSASLSNIATATVPATDAEAGAVYELEVWGNGQNGSTSQTLLFGVGFGGNAMSQFTIGAGAWSASQNFRFRMVARVICLTTGTTGTWQSMVYGELSGTANLIPANSANVTGGFMQCESVGTTTVNTTVAQTLALQVQWGATTGAPTISSRVAMFGRIA